jgi:hypothetical protein
MNRSLESRLYWLLRAAVFTEFIGHGAFGIITKKAWVPYFGVVGIPPAWAWKLMPIVGCVDILAGLSILLWPRRAVVLYMAIWGFWTALLRPLAGETVWETLDRAGNYGVPLALLFCSKSTGWAARLHPRPLDFVSRNRIAWILRFTTAALLIGHGAFGAVVRKPQLTQQLASIGLSKLAETVLGGFEIALGLAVLLQVSGPLLLFICGWKLATEFLYPLSGAPIWEFVERGASYAAPLALFLLNRQSLGSGPVENQIQTLVGKTPVRGDLLASTKPHAPHPSN